MRRHLKLSVAALLTGLLLSGCMVGPDFHPPCGPRTKTYTEPPQPTKTISSRLTGDSGKSQHFIKGRDIPAEWWQLFKSPAITKLIRQGFAYNQSVAAAQAALRQARETLYAQIGSTMLPAVDASFAAQRTQSPALSALAASGSTLGAGTTTSSGLSGGIFNLFDAGITVSYTLDVFGGLRRQIEAVGATVDFEAFELEATYLTLAANIATTAITTASLREQIKATRELVQYQRETLRIVRGQFELGGASRADILQQESQLASTLATLPPLQQALDQNRHALSVLIGDLPSCDKIPNIDLEKLFLPKSLPISIPTLLVRQRPDIRASEALMHNAMAQIGVATANLFPQINLTGSYGWESTVASSLGRTFTNAWTYAGSLTQPLFHGGALLATRRAAIANYQNALATYKLTVQQGFQNVADTLKAIVHDAQTLKAEKAAEIAAQKTLELTQMQLKLGGVNFLALLIAERQYQLARLARIRAQAARYTDTVALFQALGGGWWNRPPPMDTCCRIIKPVGPRRLRGQG